MFLGIPHNGIPLVISIVFISITLSKTWGFRRKDSLAQVSRRLRWILSFVNLAFILIMALIIFLVVMLLLNYLVPDPIIRIRLLNRLGFILIPFAGFFDWMFDPWPKFLKEEQGKVEYLHPPKLMNKTIEK